MPPKRDNCTKGGSSIIPINTPSICELANAAQMRQIASRTAGPSAKRCGAWCCSRLASESVWGNADVHSADRGIAKRKSAWTRLPMRCMPQPENHRPRKVPPRGKLPAEVSYTFIAVAYWINLTYFLPLFCDVIPFSHHFISMGWCIH